MNSAFRRILSSARPTALVVFRRAQVAVALGAGAAVFALLVATRAEPEVLDVEESVLPVAVVAAEPGEHAASIFAYGEVVALREVDLRARVGGPVLRIAPAFADGGRVGKDEVLIEIDPFEYERQLEEAEARLRELVDSSGHQERLVGLAEERRDLARRESERQSELAKRRVISEKARESALAGAVQAESELSLRRQQQAATEAGIAAFRAAAARARRNLEDTRILAPFAGHLASVTVDAGQTVAGGERLARLIDTVNLEARFFVAEGKLGRIARIGDGGIGAPCTVTWRIGGETLAFPAEVVRIDGEIAPGRAGLYMHARILVDDPAPLRPGAFVEVELFEEPHAGVVPLPREALREGPSVYVAEDGRARRRGVEVAAQSRGTAFVRGGLAPGDPVIVVRSGRIKPGTRIRVVGPGGGGDGG